MILLHLLKSKKAYRYRFQPKQELDLQTGIISFIILFHYNKARNIPQWREKNLMNINNSMSVGSFKNNIKRIIS